MVWSDVEDEYKTMTYHPVDWLGIKSFMDHLPRYTTLLDFLISRHSIEYLYDTHLQ